MVEGLACSVLTSEFSDLQRLAMLLGSGVGNRSGIIL
jgi:hypothetical protein